MFRYAVVNLRKKLCVTILLTKHTLVDRIVHHGSLVEFKGESRRVADSLMLGNRKEG